MFHLIYFWTLDVNSTASSEITLVRPSVTSFLKILSLVFSDIVHDDSWSWRSQIFEKKIGGPNLGQNGPKSDPKLVFFATFSSLVH